MVLHNLTYHAVRICTENTRLITRAFAIAHKYKEVYERDGNMKEIIKTEKTSWRGMYR
jgi:hypothetical protein